MARIRTIKPEFWTDEKIISLPYVARLFFIGLWNFCDDHGAIEDKPEQLRLLVLPNEQRIDVFQIVDLLIVADLVERYLSEEEDKTFLLIKNWASHQKVDHPAKSKILKEGSRKLAIPLWVRRTVAEKYKCKPGEESKADCYFCGKPGRIYWSKRSDGSPASWVSFTHELSHLNPESEGGEPTPENLILACTSCNRSMGVKNAFEWLLSGRYCTNQINPTISTFREHSRTFAQERNGKERNGSNRAKALVGHLADASAGLQVEYKKLIESLTGKERKDLWLGVRDFILTNKPGFIDPYVDAWNLFAPTCKLSSIEGISDKRKKKFNTRIQEEMFDFLKILERIKTSQMLKGENGNGWKVSFDWIFENDSNYVKIIEGNYN